MRRKWFTIIGVPAVAAAALLLGADKSFGRGGGNGGGGGHGSGGGHASGGGGGSSRGASGGGSFRSSGSLYGGSGMHQAGPAYRQGSGTYFRTNPGYNQSPLTATIGAIASIAATIGAITRIVATTGTMASIGVNAPIDAYRRRDFDDYRFSSPGLRLRRLQLLSSALVLVGLWLWQRLRVRLLRTTDRFLGVDPGDASTRRRALCGDASIHLTRGGTLPSDQGATLPDNQGPAVPDNAVLIGVRVPANAVVWFNGDRTSQTGDFREFQTPPLTPGQEFSYDVRAQWTRTDAPSINCGTSKSTLAIDC